MTESLVATGERQTYRRRDVRAFNALRHGLAVSVVPDHELAEFEPFRARMLGELAPVGLLEENLAERAARAAWHRERLERWEAIVLDGRYRQAMERALFPPGSKFDVEFDPAAPVRSRPPEELDLPGALVALTEVSGRDARPYLLAGVGPQEFVPGKCKGGGERVRNLYARASRLLYEQLGKGTLASDEDLARYQRYASHHDRDFYRALHELEARQSARRGQPMPLARLEVHGGALPGAEVA